MPDVFIDASSAILLYKAGSFEKAAELFPLVMARPVAEEVFRETYPGAERFKRMAGSGQIGVRVPDLSACLNLEGFGALGRGEQGTIALSMGAEPDSFVIMDDGKGARFCFSHGIPFINALLVPKIFWYSDRMDEETALQQMKTLAGLGRYSRRIIQKAFSLSRQDLTHFIQENTRP